MVNCIPHVSDMAFEPLLKEPIFVESYSGYEIRFPEQVHVLLLLNIDLKNTL